MSIQNFVPRLVRHVGPTVFNCGETSLTLTASSTWPGATYEWSNGAKTASVTLHNIGRYSVTMYSGTCTATAYVTLTVNFFPNPVREKLEAEISSTGKDPVQLRLLNLSGVVVTEKQVTPFNGKQKVSMPVNRFTMGLYFLEVVSGNEKVYKRVMLD